MQRNSIIICLLFTLLSGPAWAQGAGTVRGKVNFQGKPLQGAKTYLFKSAASFTGKADYEAPPTGADGAFELRPAPGQYFLIAKKSQKNLEGELEPGDLYAYYGGNPVIVKEGDVLNVGINCTQVLGTSSKFEPGGPGIRGTVFLDGKPLDRTRVTLYQDGDTIFRGIGYASTLTNKAGEFSFNLAPGEYFIVARRRAAEDRMGPLGEGDFFGFAHQSPVVVKEDLFTLIAINGAAKLAKVKEGGQDVTLGGTVKAGETVVEGVIRDKTGKPVAGVYAMAYRDSMMTQKPDFISRITGPDGSYAIDLPEGGEYFIGARNTMGGPAERGDLLGRYPGTEEHSVKMERGEKRKGVDIVVEPVE
jgi:hypothetical protein